MEKKPETLEKKPETQNLIEVYLISMTQEVDILNRMTKENPQAQIVLSKMIKDVRKLEELLS
tara:strand:+ start:293 stop:478 length:186 start_codon:yes stop_codon:yes gene_type:complete